MAFKVAAAARRKSCMFSFQLDGNVLLYYCIIIMLILHSTSMDSQKLWFLHLLSAFLPSCGIQATSCRTQHFIDVKSIRVYPSVYLPILYA